MSYKSIAIISCLLSLFSMPGVCKLNQAHSRAHTPKIWFSKMQSAMREKNYRMHFLNIETHHMQSLLYSHGVIDQKEVVTLTSQNGAPHSIYRVGNQVAYPLSIGVKSSHIANAFHQALYRPWQDVSRSYYWKLSNSMRIAGRESQIINIIPHDSKHYHYQLYVDKQTYLPLQFDTLSKKQVVERMMVVELSLLDKPEPKLYEALKQKHPLSLKIQPQLGTSKWSFGWLPSNMSIKNHRRHMMSDQTEVEYWLLDDGIAQASVYCKASTIPHLPPRLTLSKSVHMVSYYTEHDEVVIIGQLPADIMHNIAFNMKHQSGKS